MNLIFVFLAAITALASPETRRENICEKIHGQKVCDPYRWMEKIETPEVRDWVSAQNSASRKILDQSPQRSKIEKLLKSFAASVVAPPLHHENGLFYIISKGSLYSGPSEEKPENLLVDVPALFGNPKAAIADFSLSPDGSKILLLVNFYGADLPGEILIYDLSAKKVLENALAKGASNYLGQNWIRGPFWLPDSQSYVYTKITLGALRAPVKSSLVRRKIGQNSEELLFEDQKAKQDLLIWYGRPTKSGEHLIVQTQGGEQEPTKFGVLPLKSSGKINWVVKDRLFHYLFLGDNGTSLFFRTNHGANNLKIISVDLKEALRGKFEEKEIIPEMKTNPIVIAGYASGKFFVVTMDPSQQQKNLLSIYDEGGHLLKKIEGPGPGSLDGLRFSERTNELYFHYNDYFQPRTLMKIDFGTLKEVVVNQPKAPFEKSNFSVRTLDLPGTKEEPSLQITLLEPSSLLVGKEKAPLLLHFYGNVAGTLTPQYNAKFLTFLKMGGRVAIAHVRGGPDKGHAWVDDGRALNKKNTFRDVIRATETLQSQGLTDSSFTLLDGRSSGGFNVLALANLRPELFGVVASTVPMTDMVRYPLFAWGNRWLYEYGDPKKPDEFKNLLKYSPYHNVKEEKNRPAIIVFTADHDDRVNPIHAYKVTAALQNVSPPDNPVLMVEDKEASHGSKVEALDELTFAAEKIKFQF